MSARWHATQSRCGAAASLLLLLLLLLQLYSQFGD